jgi:hypothetical protein
MMPARCEIHLLKAGSCLHPEAAALKGGSLCPVDFPALTALILHPTEGALLWDTGYDPAFFRATRRWPERLYALTTPVTLGEHEPAARQISRFGLPRRDSIARGPGWTRCAVLDGFRACARACCLACCPRTQKSAPSSSRIDPGAHCPWTCARSRPAPTCSATAACWPWNCPAIALGTGAWRRVVPTIACGFSSVTPPGRCERSERTVRRRP